MVSRITALAAALVTAVPAAPCGSGPTSIRIERCAILSRSLLQDPFNALRQEFVSGVAVRFVNTRDIPATSITLTLRYEGETATIEERGSFAPGVPIERTLSTFAGRSSGAGSARCTIDAASFADAATRIHAAQRAALR